MQSPYKKPFVLLVIFASVFSHLQLIVVSAEDIVVPVVTEVVAPAAEVVTPVEPEAPIVSDVSEAQEPAPAQTGDIAPEPISDTTSGDNSTVEVITGDNTVSFTGTSSSGTQGAGGTMGIEESPLSAASGANTALPPKTVLIQDGTISINDEESSATLKKDDQLKIREIQLEERVVVTGAAGVTVIIPEDTKIFSPEKEETESVVSETPTITTGESTSATGDESTPSVLEEINNAQVINTPQEMIATESGFTAEIISSSFSGTLEGEQTAPVADVFEGQAPLQSDNLTIEKNTIDQVEWTSTGTRTERTFSFGMDDQHLVFTKPVEIHIATPNLIDGTLVMVRVKHAGDKGFSMQGIATNAGLTCDNKGNITSESETTVVQNGEVVFYTCGASAFALGVLDSMNPGVGASYIAVQQSDGAIIVGGGTMSFGGGTRNGLARITTTGLLDPGYNPNLEGGVVNGIAIQADGKVIAGGTFTSVGGGGSARIARITTTGIFDSSWRVTVDNTVVAVFVQPSDQAILVGGSFTTVSGMNTTAVTRNRVVRFSSSGYVESFNPNVDSFVTALGVQSDGKVIIGGYFFSAIGGQTRNRLGRVSATGLVDSWRPDPDGIITAVAVQPDDATVFGGAFTTVSGATITRNRIARITSTGLIDSKFNPNAGGQVQALAVQSDGKIYVGGAVFSTIGARPISNFARLNKDGSVDTTFIATVNSSVNAIAIDTFNNAVVLGGTFTTVRGIAKNGVARLGTIESICGGFEGCSSWFNANTGVVFTSTGLVSSWRSHAVYDNFSGMQNTGSLMPTYITGNAMNYNSIIRFTSGHYMLVSGQYFNQFDNSLFVVFRTPHNSGALFARPSTLVLAPAACDEAMVLSGGKLTTQLSGQTITSTINVNSNSPVLASLIYGTGFGQALNLSGVSNATGTTTGVKAALNPTSGLIIGNVGSNCVANGAFSGDIAEIITFNRMLTTSEANMVNSYLALKYAITLDQTTGHDYTLSGGLTAWSRLSAGVYNKDIAGVGRNDASSLLQYTGKSSNNSGDIQVTFTGTFTNNTTLVRGNDGGATGTLVTGDANNAPATYKRIPRTWKFQERNGDLGAVVVSYFTGNTLSAGTGALFMFVNTGGTSLSGSFTTRYTGSLANGIWEFPPVNFVDGALMTFGFFDVAPAGTITIEASTGFAYTGTYLPSFLVQSATKYFAQSTNDRFRVVDTLGTDPGYTTTIQLAGDLTTGSLSIPATNVQFKVSSTGVDLVDGTTNPRVVIDNAAINYQSLNTPRTFIYRATAANSSVVGTYGAYIWLNTDMPAAQYAGAYSGVVVFTLIPN